MQIHCVSISTSLVSTLITIVLLSVVIYGKSVPLQTPPSSSIGHHHHHQLKQVQEHGSSTRWWTSSSSVPNFVSERFMSDGERERRVHLGGITVRETSAVDSSDHRRLRLVQVTDGRHFVQSIYDGLFDLKDCEYVRDRDSVLDFLAQMRPDFEWAQSLEEEGEGVAATMASKGNATLRLLEGSRVSDDNNNEGEPELRRLTDYTRVRNECKQLHKKMKEMVHLAKDTQVDNEQLSRRKRELFIYPGTNWCGAGSTGSGFTDLGWHAAADRCCRQHDHCPKTIQGLTTDFNLFNYRFHTISDCECDERFRTCLKMVDNEHSNLVGKIFFNVVQMKCFKLKPEKVCLKRSWWGRCLKHGRKMSAHLKDPLPY